MTCGVATNCVEDAVKIFGAAGDKQRTLDDCLQACVDNQALGCNSINFLETDCKILTPY